MPLSVQPEAAVAQATGQEAELRLTSAVEDLGRLYPWLDEAAAEVKVPAALLPGMHVALEEAVVNAALHGFAPDAAGEITVRLRVEAGAAVLSVADNGAAFDPTTAPVRARADSLNDETPGGWGLGLIRHFCPAAAYERCADLNHLTLRFPIGG